MIRISNGSAKIYFSMVCPGVAKGSHVHTRMTLNYAVVSVTIKLVRCDERAGSKTRGEFAEPFIGENNYAFVQIPPRVVNGFKGVGVNPAIVANCSTEPHDPSGIHEIDSFRNEILYDWGLKYG